MGTRYSSFGFGPDSDCGPDHPSEVLKRIKPQPPSASGSVKVLSWNLQLLPKCCAGPTYPCKWWEQRVADMFTDPDNLLQRYDVLTVQECFSGLPGCFKDIFVSYAKRAGFTHVAESKAP